jgi:hypothetical protein
MRSHSHPHGSDKSSGRFIEEAERKVFTQKLLIKSLRAKGKPTADALATLKGYEETLFQLRNHALLMSELMAEQTEPQKG